MTRNTTTGIIYGEKTENKKPFRGGMQRPVPPLDGASRRRYSSMTAEESSTDQLQFLYLSEEAELSVNLPSGFTEPTTTSNESQDEEDEHSLLYLQAHPQAARPSALNQREKERVIETALEQWGAPKQALVSVSPKSTARGESPKERGGVVRARSKELDKIRKERVKSVVASWKDGPPFMHASIDVPRPAKGRKNALPLRAVLDQCRQYLNPTPQDISHMACWTSVGGGLLEDAQKQQPRQVLLAIAQLMNDKSAISQIQASGAEHLPQLLGGGLDPRGPTASVVRVISRAVMAPLEHAFKDALVFKFNLVRQSWGVRVEKFPSSTIVVTHTRLERSAPGHAEEFEFSWNASFLLRGDPLEISELLVELSALHVEGKHAERITKAFGEVFGE
jgi:hypothetical protein